jgi:hypothetical protein
MTRYRVSGDPVVDDVIHHAPGDAQVASNLSLALTEAAKTINDLDSVHDRAE